MMLGISKRSRKRFLRRQVAYITTLAIFLHPIYLIEPVIGEMIEEVRISKEQEVMDRELRTYVDPELSLVKQQSLLVRKKVKSLKQALATSKRGKDVKSLMKDMEVLQSKLRAVYLRLQLDLVKDRARLLEQGHHPVILERHDAFIKSLQENHEELDRKFRLVRKYRGNSNKLKTHLKDSLDFLEPVRSKKIDEKIRYRSQPHLPRHGIWHKRREASSHVLFDWPWRLASSDDINVLMQVYREWLQFSKVVAEGDPTTLDLRTVTDEPDELENGTPYEINYTAEAGDAIFDKAQELENNPVKIFEFVRNELAYEPYFGSIKGARRTLEEGAGNDMDLASLLIALYRVSDIPCRYVYGTIELPINEAKSWLGINDPAQVEALLVANGVPVSVPEDGMAGGQISKIQLDHVWVRAHVDNFPYRGSYQEQDSAGKPVGDTWIELDPSYKQHTYTAGRDIDNAVGINPDGLYNNALADAVTSDPAETTADSFSHVYDIDEELITEQMIILAQPIREYLTANGLTTETVYRQRKVSDERYGILPVSDQYAIVSRAPSLHTLPDEFRHKIRLTLSNPDNTLALNPVTYALPQIEDTKITLTYKPDPIGQNYLDNLGSFSEFQPHLVQVTPILTVDDIVTEGSATTARLMGTLQKLEVKFISPFSDNNDDLENPDSPVDRPVEHFIPAGGVHALVIDPQQVTADQLLRQEARLQEVSDILADSSAANTVITNAHDTLGESLHGIGLSYFHQMDTFNKITAGAMDLAITRQPSMVRVSWDLNIVNPPGGSENTMAVEADQVRIFIVRDAHTPVMINDPETYDAEQMTPEARFLYTSAMTSNALEYNALMQALPNDFQGGGAVSAAKAIQLANGDEATKIFTLTPELDINSLLTSESDTELKDVLDTNDLADLPADVHWDIWNSLKAGLEVTVTDNIDPTDFVTVNEVEYSAYIKRHIETGASDLVLYNSTEGRRTSGEIKVEDVATSAPPITPVHLLLETDSDDTTYYPNLQSIVDSARDWMTIAADSTVSAGITYLPAITDISHWLAEVPVDRNTTAMSVLAVTGPIERLTSQHGIFDVSAFVEGEDAVEGWVSDTHTKFRIQADVTNLRDAGGGNEDEWRVVLKYDGLEVNGTEQLGTTRDLDVTYDFSQPPLDDDPPTSQPDGRYLYEITTVPHDTEENFSAVPISDAFWVDRDVPDAEFTNPTGNGEIQNGLGRLTVYGTAKDTYFDHYEIEVSQDNVSEFFEFDSPVDNWILGVVDTTSFDAASTVDVTLHVYDLAGNVESTDPKTGETIIGPDQTAPNITFSAIWGAQDTPIEQDDTFVEEGIEMSFDFDPVEDEETLGRVEIWVDKDTDNERLIYSKYDINGFDADDVNTEIANDPLEVYTLSNGLHTLTAIIWDVSNNPTTDTKIFVSDSFISNFKVTPSVATNAVPTVAIGGYIKDSDVNTIEWDKWDLDIVPKDSETSLDSLVVGGTATTINTNFDASGLSDDTYRAKVTLIDDITPVLTAYASFDVAMDKPIARITDWRILPNEPDDETLPLELKMITDGLLSLKGRAYHPSVAGSTELRTKYKIEVDGDGGAFVVTPEKDDGDYRINEVLPGDPEGLGMLDLTGVPNGNYTVTLTVELEELDEGDWDPVIGGSQTDAVDFILNSPLKIGNVTFSQEDMAIPVAGVPLRVVRTYNSFNKDRDSDFGFGWEYAFASLDVELEDHSFDWGARNVTLTLPDTGQRTTFSFRLGEEVKRSLFNSKWPIFYDAPKDVTATLTTKDTVTLRYGLFGSLGNYRPGYYWNDNEPQDGYSPAPWFEEFSGFTLTLEDGTEYHIERGNGTPAVQDGVPYTYYDDPYLTRIVLPTGERIEFNVDFSATPPKIGAANSGAGIQHYDVDNVATQAIKIDYGDPQSADEDHIVAIWGPKEQGPGEDDPTVKYEYDQSTGDLLRVKSLVDPDGLTEEDKYEKLTYVYGDINNPHFITEIQDPRGVSPIRYVYDTEGVLIKTIDANDREIVLSRGVDPEHGNAQIVKDRMGRETKYYHDNRGRVTAIENNQSYFTFYDYEDRNWKDSPSAVTQPYPPGNTTLNEYDSKGRDIETIDPEGDVTRNSYRFDTHPDGRRLYLHEATQQFPNPENREELMPPYSTTRTWYEDDNMDRVLETVDALGSRTVNAYDSANRLDLVSRIGFDGLTSETDYEYDEDTGGDPLSGSADQAYSVTEPSGAVQYFHYNENGNQDASWYFWDDPYEVEDSMRVMSITDYDRRGRAVRTRRVIDDNDTPPTSSTDQAFFDVLDNDDGELLSQTFYNTAGQTAYSIDGNGVVSESRYNKLGNVVATITYSVDITTVTWPYDTVGDLEDDLENVAKTLSQTSTHYDAEGRVVAQADAIDLDDPLDGSDPYTAEEDIIGTHSVYDSLGRAKFTRRYKHMDIDVDAVAGLTDVWESSYTEPDSEKLLSQSETFYDPAGRTKWSSRPDDAGTAQETHFEYDKAGRQTAVTDALGNRTEYTYEGSRRVSMTDARGNTTRYAYDDLGRQIYTFFPDDGVNGETQTFVDYDGLGRKVLERDQAGREKQFEYDAAGRLTAVTMPEVDLDPHGAGNLQTPVYEYFYDDYGNQVGLLDPKGRLTVFQYDHLHNQIAKYQPFDPSPTEIEEAADIFALNLSSYTPEVRAYDVRGRLKKVIDFEGQVTGYFYQDEDRGLLQYQRYYLNDTNYNDDPSLGTDEWGYDNTYDALGRRTIAVENDDIESSGLTWTTTYDEQGRVDMLEQADQGFVWYDYHDSTGQKKTVRTPDEDNTTDPVTEVAYRYDELNRLEEVQQVHRNATQQPQLGDPLSGEITTYTYNEVGSLATVSYPNGNSSEYVYDALNRLINLTHKDDQAAQLHRYEYTLAKHGRREAVCEYDENGADASETQWQYDALDRLIDEAYDDLTVSDEDHDLGYAYDLAGNRVEKIDGYDSDNDVDYTYNDTDQLQSEDVAVGNDTSYTYDDNGSLESKTLGSTTQYYVHDLRQRLEEINDGTDPIANYAYDPDGIRVQKALYGGVTTDYLIDPDNHTGYAQAFRESPSSGSDRVYTLGLDVIGQADGTGDPEYFLYDGHGSVRHLTDDDGAVTETYNFDAYGNKLANSEASPTTDLLYAGEMFDSTLGFIYLRARYYNPANGRFNRADPFAGINEDPQSLHKYLYAHANPVMNVDPSGLLILVFILGALKVLGLIGSVFGAIQIGWSIGAALTGRITWAQLGRQLLIDALMSVGGLALFKLAGRVLKLVGKIRKAAPDDPSPAPKLLPGPAGGKLIQHHIFNKFRGTSPGSQKYRDFFLDKGIVVDDFIVRISKEFHVQWIHKAGRNWTTRWKKWIDENPNASTQQVFNQGGRMMEEAGIAHLEIFELVN